jgi:hypothetical protein
MDIKSSFEENGFYVFKAPTIELERVQNASDGMDKIREGEYDTGRPPANSPWNPGDDPARLCKIEQPQLGSTAIAELIRSPEIGEWAAYVKGAEMIQVWWVQLLYKPPASDKQPTPTKIGWHTDWQYWGRTWEGGSQLLTAWVALSDVEASSGPMKFVASSNHWEEITGGDFYSQELSEKAFALSPDRKWEEISALMDSGGMSLHDKRVLHGSSFNLSEAPRRSLAIHLRTERSRPINGKREGLAGYIDDLDTAPIIYGEKAQSAFV